MDAVPVVSQVKSLVQWLCGDTKGACQTQSNFSKKCLGVSQIRSVVHLVKGDIEQAKQVQKTFLKCAEQSIDGIPIIGHIKAGVHYISGDQEKGNNSLESADRTLGTLIGGVIGGFFGGPGGAVAGGIAGGFWVDSMQTAQKSVEEGKYQPKGIYAKIEQIKNQVKNNQNISGNAFDLVMIPVADGLAGYSSFKLVQKIQLNQSSKKLYRVMTEDEVQEAVKTQKLKPGYRQTGPLAETCVTQSIQHQKTYIVDKTIQNPQLKMSAVQMRVDNQYYGNMKETNLIEQRDSRPINQALVKQGKIPKNVFTKERLQNTNKINVNIKGPQNLENFNNNIVEIKQINPNDVKYTNQFTRKIARYGRETVELALEKNPTKLKQQKNKEY